MHIFLFILYGIILCTAVTRIPFFKRSGLKTVVLVFFFLLRVGMGALHNWIAYRYYPLHGDVWAFFRKSFITRHELLTDLHLFWEDNSTLSYLAHNLIIGMHVILNIFSFDNLYINTLLFSFFSFAGSIALFRAFNRFFGGNLLCSLTVLLLPSTLFWTSCIHTEGIVYLLLGFLFLYLSLYQTGLHFLLLFLAILLFRPGILPGLLPALAFWLLAEKYRSDKSFRYATPIPTMLLVASTLFLILAFSGVFHAGFQYICNRQQDFHALTGNSRLYLPLLEPTFGSFLKVLPTAILNGFFQPLPGSGGQKIYTIFSLENIFIWGILFFALGRSLSVFARKSFSTDFPADFSTDPSPLLITGICFLLFALINMLIIGYTIPFAGAIIRYRSIFLPFLLGTAFYIFGKNTLVQNLNRWLNDTLQKRLPDPVRE